MKNVVTCLVVLLGVFGFSQTQSVNGIVVREMPKLENIAVTVTVDSAKELESTFKIEDIEEILESSEDNETLSFEIVCNGKRMSNGKKSYVSYKVDGNSNNVQDFVDSVETIRKAAIKYYNNKK